MNAPDLHIVALQSNLHWQDPAQNRAAFETQLRSIKTPIDIAVLPEMFTTGFTMQVEQCAEDDTNSATLNWMLQLSKELNCVLTGSIIIKQNENYYNRLYWVEPNGNVAHYNKRHLFRMANENDFYTAGEEKLILTYKGWKICPLVCYDLRFPVWSRNKATSNGMEYDLLLYVANWPQKRSHAWKTLLQARAIENLSYVVGLNRVGEDANKILYSGDSAIIDFKGEHLVTATTLKEEILKATLSYDLLIEYRNTFPAYKDADEFTVHQ